MRCPKCGYNSFDYLSQCKKCGTDLTKTRHELGMLHIKPTNPFLLGTLLKDSSETQAKEEKVLEAAPGFDDFRESRSGQKEDTIDLPSPQPQAQMADASPAAFTERPPQPSSPASKPGAAKDDDFSIELTDELADWSFLDEQMDESRAPQPENIESSEVKPGESGKIDLGSRRHAEGEDDNVIELSEEDLEGLFLELDDTDDKKDKTDKSQ